MHENDLFPLEAVPSSVRLAILREFDGRRPTAREVGRISDKSWLAVPGIGRTALASIRQATSDPQSWDIDGPAVRMSDAELLTRLASLQGELQSLSRALSAALSPAPKRGFRSGRVRRTSSIAHRHQG